MLMVFYVTVGGMKGTTWVQIVKAVLLMSGTVLITVLVLAEFDFNLSELLARPPRNGQGRGVPQPGLKYGIDTTRGSTSSRSAWPWCSAPPVCRTS